MRRLRFRIRVAGLLVEKKKILAVVHEKEGKRYFLLPGGGVRPKEKMERALSREFEEELSLKVEVGEFLFAGESIGRFVHLIQFVFSIPQYQGKIEVHPDYRLRDYKWLSKEEFLEVPFFPDCKEQILSFLEGKNFPRFLSYSWQKF